MKYSELFDSSVSLEYIREKMIERILEEKEKRIIGLKEVITGVEELRIGASRADGSLDTNQLDLALAMLHKKEAEYQPYNMDGKWRVQDLGLNEVVGLAHIYFIHAEILTSKAKYSLGSPVSQRIALGVAGENLDKAMSLSKVLKEKGFLQTINGSPFVWPVEITRNQARIWEMMPDFGDEDKKKEYLCKAKGCFQNALDFAKNICLEQMGELRYAALMAVGTVRIDSTLIDLQMEELGESHVSNSTLVKEFSNALCELSTAWYFGNKDWERFDLCLSKMIEVLEKREIKPKNLRHLEQNIMRRRAAHLCEIKRRGGKEGELAAKRLEETRLLKFVMTGNGKNLVAD